MLESITHFLTQHPSVAVFICLALGYILGCVHFRSFTLGSTVGVLLVGLLIGQVVHFQFPAIVKNIFFDLFIFTIGYEVGPSFVRSFKKDGLRFICSGIFFAVSAFFIAFFLFKAFHIGKGEGAGIIAGALTQSAVIGTSASSIHQLPLSEATKNMMNSKVAIAYALTYVFGAAGMVVFIKDIAPKILRIRLKEATKKRIEEIQYTGNIDESSFEENPLALRCFLLEKDSAIVGWSVQQFNEAYHHQLVLEKICQKEGGELRFHSSTKLQVGMIISVVGQLAYLVQEQKQLGTEIFDPTYRDIEMEEVNVFLTKAFKQESLADFSEQGIVVKKAINRQNQGISIHELQAGDRIQLLGPKNLLVKVIPKIGYPCDGGAITDISFIALGIILGVSVGSLVLYWQGIPFTLGTGGGALFAGLLFGWWQDQHPRYGHIPTAVRWLLKSLGLNTFIACVGLGAGAAFIPALKEMGWTVLFLGMLVSLLPSFLTLLFNHYVLKLNPIDNLGALAGSETVTPALNALTEASESSIFALAYTPTYAIGNILLTLIGPLMIALL